MELLHVLLVFLSGLYICFSSYIIRLDTKWSPPPITPFEINKYVYSVPMNQMISKPIIAYIEFMNGSRVTSGPVSTETFQVSTIDEKMIRSSRFKDSWAASGELCQKTAWWLDYPDRLDRSLWKNRCGSNVSSTTLLVKAIEGKIIIDWIYHRSKIIPLNKRVILIELPKRSLKAYTNPFRITAPAHHLTITKHPPLKVTANQDFTVEAEIRFDNDSVVDDGLDSVVYVYLCLPYYLKMFSNKEHERMLLKDSIYRLGGPDVIIHQGNQDFIMRKQAVKGKVSFKNIRILNPGTDVRLNLTMTMIHDPYRRVPECDHCYDDIYLQRISRDRTEITFGEPDVFLLKKLLSVKLTRKFVVEQQTLHKIILSEETIHELAHLKDPNLQLVPITRNAEIPGEIVVIAKDVNNRTIYAGTDSKFDLIYRTIPHGVCLSVDSTKTVEFGAGQLLISFCQTIDNVTLEIIPSIRANASVYTPSFKVEGYLTLYHFGDFRYSGDGAQVESHVNSFIRYAVNDINQGIKVPYLSRNGFILRLGSYDTESSTEKAYEAVEDLAEKETPKDKPRMIISSTTEDITNVISADLSQMEVPLYSISNMGYVFADKDIYPFFNRVCWSEHEVLDSVLDACQERMWKELVVIRDIKASVNDLLFHMAHETGIKIIGVVDIDTHQITYGYISYFKKEMDIARRFGTKVFILIALKDHLPYILRAAQLANLDSLHGYQWIMYGKFAWNFPFSNDGVCSVGVSCTAAFKSTYFFSETYNISGYDTEDWIRVMGYHFSMDRFKYKGGRIKYRPPEVGAKWGLGYDTVLLYAQALQKILSRRETIHGEKIVEESRHLKINGLTGTFELNENGDRMGYFGFLAQLNPIDVNDTFAHISKKISFVRVLTRRPDGSQIEIPYMAWRSNSDSNNPVTQTLMPETSKFNTRIYESISGVVNQFTQKMVQNPVEPWPPISYIRKEKVVPIYFCEKPCGKNILSASDITVYDTGRCVIGGKCLCNQGYHGNSCLGIDCKCKYGLCLSASHCSCYPGWKGLECNIAICDRCVNGLCTSPGMCECSSSLYFGGSCDYHVAAVVLPIILGIIVLGVIIAAIIRYVISHADRNKALANNDWIVEWNEVTPLVPEIASNSQISLSGASQRMLNVVMWKKEKWYSKAIESWTIDRYIPDMRLEMVNLVKLSHRNLISYGGASLTAPNVCLLVEIADKGSMYDILKNEAIDVGWEFKYSFMRDICAGMKFLHEKVHISHGRLKSHNCLIDSRWTVRISGYGAHYIRFGRFRLPTEEKEPLKNLLWTAPELLINATCLDDVECGTVPGDVYSFSIIVCEILTRAEPYSYELLHVSEEVILDLISNNVTSSSIAGRKIWESIGGEDMFSCRPILQEEALPSSGVERQLLAKMLDDAWKDNPSARPSFDKLGAAVLSIHPVKGELIDNLISLLEKYSNNLEQIVIERTQELEVSKARAELLLSQMLPKKVTRELTKGNKVPPEIFNCATVFFSDIVDFQAICQTSTPLQIVDFLNETYKTFDDVLDTYDVYKVETISDSYMVVSGVPETNGIKHASEIATMALHLMSKVTNFQIPHKPLCALQLRIGINSGPVVAGVVGVLMPRYCLFGDTVNTASRMESSSQALCIQVSDTTAEILDQIGGFELESRGEREVKGRGRMTTYWLWGKDDFNEVMPDQSLAISLSQHKFK